MTMFATSGKRVATEPASHFCCIICCFLSIIAAYLFLIMLLLSKEKAPSSRGSLLQVITA
jgi:hypothetical protein